MHTLEIAHYPIYYRTYWGATIIQFYAVISQQHGVYFICIPIHTYLCLEHTPPSSATGSLHALWRIQEPIQAKSLFPH